MWCYIIGAYLTLHYFIDTHYFVRLFVHCICARYFLAKKKFMESSSIYGICMPTDVDMMLNHMNNSRYLREFDFGRMEYGFRTGLMDTFIKKGGSFLVSGITIRYRLSLKIFSMYKVVTTPVWWDDKFIYFDQRIVTLSDDIVRAVAFAKLATKISMVEYIKEMYPEERRPDNPPADLMTWLESQEISRNNMKKES
ncbi:unnamed protein product [Allacma fusca]|uniref:Thioesterase n=1 Tax=Allacma fusca TaxID=39272 RepID=A0A8J2NSK3_9HEXA|nr:unnamed protein product [Allacma fusca]